MPSLIQKNTTKTVDKINNICYNVFLWLYEATRKVFWTGVRIPPGPP
jgi:hypothetical protein